ncbi:CDP-glycerol glycerophosphotransferase family protein [Staphylococcus coagulans]|uniref:CDP-glycerol glycerophosphotransferase family protein n=1 Tax=Staphylococcus coagulans TaxID=74706 RepID=A0A9X0PGU6_9STAP|nr:CDP-glycerol glycerophosphotransferase family protein [Staphylococcus coagulans]MBA8771803.1 CDP-glycerol glycerophosphotransferase family protein [Staphylococcus coagulans]MBA8777526.1 CDP-glycerol glycerophosphotransferase family protein [Staphylococcus coagulans]
MHIKILGYHIFQKGGTTRSNLNLIQSLCQAGHQVTYVNYMGVRKQRLKSLIAEEGGQLKNVKFQSFLGANSIAHADLLIITREDFFIFAREVKQLSPETVILGEIHSPLAYISPHMDLALEAVDTVRVSTEAIARAFEQRYDYSYVFPMYVNTNHLKIAQAPTATTHNLLIKARFEDEIKDISYALKMMRYFIHERHQSQIHLYLQGYGPSLELYENLVRYYRLESNVHINEAEPESYIYFSSSPYETLGYSILEAIAQGHRVCLYPGDDQVLKAIYTPFHAVHWLQKDLKSDADTLLQAFSAQYTNQERQEDIEVLKQQFVRINDTNALIAKTLEIAQQHQVKQADIQPPKIKARYQFAQEMAKRFAIKTKQNLESSSKGPLRKGSRFYNKVRQVIFKVEGHVKQRQIRQRQVSKKHVFIESFHGKNFSGDPKYIACALKRLNPELEIYVSSADPLVDLEIRAFGMTPIRFGTRSYMRTFEKSAYVVINGNLWDRLVKHPQQCVVQTWHGFPLKRMVNDLMDEQECQKQALQFAPRMKKWDVLLSSSSRYEQYIQSAFQLKTHTNLKILREGAPRNSDLMRYQEDVERRSAIQEKYMFTKNKETRYILFCPTWRKDTRQSVSTLDIVSLIEGLPDQYEMIVKLHPNEGHLREVYDRLHPRIHCFFNELVDIQELYLISDVLITDYSSAIFDYAHLNRPILILDEDTTRYQQDIGFYFDIEQFTNIQKVGQSIEQIQNMILQNKHVDHQKMTKELMTYDQIESDNKVAQFILEQ